jgi:diguanylate cyclase (GGDEF)-like protein/PAS domain S-box-containing protein
MNSLNMPTIFFGYIFSNLVCLAGSLVLWVQSKRRFSGPGFWLVDFFLNFFAIILIALRAFIPGFFSMLVSNLALISGIWLLYLGLRRFLGRQISVTPTIYLIGLFAILQAYFIYITPSLQIRNILFSFFLAIFSFQIGWFIFKQTKSSEMKLSLGAGLTCLAFFVFSVIRIIIDIIHPPGDDLLQSKGYDALVILMYQLLYIGLTLSLIFMVNHRLRVDLEQDISDRIKAESELSLSEEKYSKAFKSSPDAILITRLKDGLCIEVNDGFCKITGYTRDDAIGKSTLSLHVWENLEDRGYVVDQIAKKGQIHGYQFNAVTRSGKIIRAELSGEFIHIGNDECMLTVIRDITEKKHVEDILQSRLRLWEYSNNHTSTELMQKSLDEIELLTGSKVSFYHLVEEDQQTLTLFAWSSATTQQFCKAQGVGMHYPVNEAGVWADCIRQRRPIIHNDYPNLENRKGLPAGHSPLQRELVVPIFHEDRIVSVLGVGNKPTNYTEQDIELVEFISGLVWSIVSQKQAEERIQILNNQLEKLVMIDELTGMSNRRSFFSRGKEEINRVQRYPEPLSLIMLDIDRFKKINDTYGHDAGDSALLKFSSIFQHVIRDVDHAARLGGEEFGILLPNTEQKEAQIIAERLRRKIAATSFDFQEKPIKMTASLGVATYKMPALSLDELLHCADTAMYQAKKAGRNQVQVFQPDTSNTIEVI